MNKELADILASYPAYLPEQGFATFVEIPEKFRDQLVAALRVDAGGGGERDLAKHMATILTAATLHGSEEVVMPLETVRQIALALSPKGGSHD